MWNKPILIRQLGVLPPDQSKLGTAAWEILVAALSGDWQRRNRAKEKKKELVMIHIQC
jgi:hypothetical protein